jgi:peptidoglycan/LPS O-acetylase OafA/YrhL
MVILNLSGPIRVFPDPDRTVLGPIGKISYGIYMYHWMIILFVLDLVPYGSIANDLVYNVVVHTLAFGGTLALSWISFNTLERYFLQKKARFRVLKT